jgi:hypothetical protein
MCNNACLRLGEEVVSHCKAHHARRIVHSELTLLCNLRECCGLIPSQIMAYFVFVYKLEAEKTGALKDGLSDC